MKRLLMAIAIAGLAVACGDDDGGDTPTPTNDGGADSGRPDSGLDGSIDSGTDASAADAAVTVRVTNTWTGCAAGSTGTCTGPNAVCQTTSPLIPGSIYPSPGGVCTATCTKTAECGGGGICPVGEAIASFPTAASMLGGAGYCSKACAIGSATCGTGYACVNVKILAQMANSPTAAQIPDVAPWNTGFCVTILRASTDGGVGDGGVSTPTDGGMDASGG